MIDPKNPVDRIIMFIPGFLTWSLILMPLWLGYLAPRAAAFILTFVAIYWVYMSYKHGYDLYRGYKNLKEETAVKWYEKCMALDFKTLPNKESLPDKLDDLKHFIVIPTYTENIDILEPTFKALMDQTVPTKNILVVLGYEEAGNGVPLRAIETLQKKYGDKFPEVRAYMHPKGMSGEIVGVASPNRRWAASHAVEELKKEGKDLSKYIMTTYDSDVSLHEEFLARVNYLYLTDKKRTNRFYQTSAMLFSNNLWEVPVLSRLEASLVTFGMLGAWNRDTRFAETYACYSVALPIVVKADYWDVRFIDDTVFFWRAFEALEGDFTGSYFRMPISSDATGGPNYITAHKNLYKQLVRWGWGSVGTVMAIKSLFSYRSKKTPLEKKLLWIYLKIERHTLQRTATFLMMFGFAMISFVNKQFGTSSTIYALPEILSVFLTGAILMFIPLAFIRRKIYPLPEGVPFVRKIIYMFEGPLILINLLTFSFLPWLQAETLMMFGKFPKTTFYTPKQRKAG